MKRELPFMGIGMSASIPEALRIAQEKLKGSNWYPVDTLNVGFHSESSVPESFQEVMQEANLGVVGHLEEINLVGSPEPDRLHALEVRAQALGCSWVEQDLGVWTWNGSRLGARMIPPTLDKASLEESIRIVRMALELFDRPFLVENPPFYAIHGGEFDILEYLSHLHRHTGCGIVLDVGHLVGYCMLTNRDPDEYLRSWTGKDQVVEVHVAGYDIQETHEGPFWLDAHNRELSPLTISLLGTLLESASNIKAITLEVESATPEIIERGIKSVKTLTETKEVDDVHRV